MKLRFSLAASLMAISVATLVAAPAAAQETTASVRGTVESDGTPVAGASVTLTHEASGTVFRTTSGNDGNFTCESHLASPEKR